MKKMLNIRRPKLARAVNAIGLVLIFVMCAFAILFTLPRYSSPVSNNSLTQVHLAYDKVIFEIEKTQAKEREKNRHVTDDKVIQDSLRLVQNETNAGHFRKARAEIAKLSKQVIMWQEALTKPGPQKPVVMVQPEGPNHTYAPILLYHHPPSDMEEQFQYLVSHGYVSVSLQQVADAQNGKSGLPAKPIVLTYDDGFADQMSVLPLLQKYNLKAVFYIINGSRGSNFHIGANKKASDPEGGDAYLSWEQIKELDDSGYAEIAAHTTNHVDLARQIPEVQREEILGGKQYLEAKLGHIVTGFCYPYGSFSQTTIDIVREAGFATATTTLPGVDQSVATPFTMRRIRNAMLLP